MEFHGAHRHVRTLEAMRTQAFSQEDVMPKMKIITRSILSFCLLALIAVSATPQGNTLTEEVEICGLRNFPLKKIKQQIKTQP